MSKTDATPTPKVTAATLGAAVASIVVFVLVKVGLDVSDGEAVVLTGSLATVFTFLAGYCTRD
jgi:hypothetical protein